jgi:RHS repeat-associated protein
MKPAPKPQANPKPKPPSSTTIRQETLTDPVIQIDSSDTRTVWFDDTTPTGATLVNDGHNWSWVVGVDADFAYTGHLYHQPSNLHLAYFRAYDAELGRWLSRDPIQDSELLPEGPNLYRYVSNLPTVAYDPLGTWLHIAAGAAIGAVIGGASGGWKGALAGAVGGAVGAALMNPAIGAAAAAGLTGAAAGLAGGVAAGAAGGFAGGLVQESLDAATGGCFSGKDLGLSTFGGAIGGGLGGAALGATAPSLQPVVESSLDVGTDIAFGMANSSIINAGTNIAQSGQ